MVWGAIGELAMKAIPSIMGAQATGASSNRAYSMNKKQLRWEKEKERYRQAAYEDMKKQGQTQFGAGEQQFLSETDQPLAELENARSSMRAGTAESMQDASGQMKSNIEAMGGRGGQGITLLNRGIGQMGVEGQRGLDQMALQEAEQRRQMRGGYMGQKAQMGQQASLQRY